jgi:hypothetical protein
MTDEFQTPNPEEEKGVAEPLPEKESATTDFTSGEGMVALAGIVILAVWIIFDVIVQDYGVTTLAIVLALLAAVLPRMKREDVEKIQRLPILMKVIGYGLVAVGIVEVINDISHGFYNNALGVIGALVAYAAYAMAFMGARSIKT